jgi:hypothetical protein
MSAYHLLETSHQQREGLSAFRPEPDLATRSAERPLCATSRHSGRFYRPRIVVTALYHMSVSRPAHPKMSSRLHVVQFAKKDV